MEFVPLDIVQQFLVAFDVEMLYAIWNGCTFYEEQLSLFFSIERVDLRALLSLPSVVKNISVRYGLEETTFASFLSAFDAQYFFSSLVGDAYRRARYLEIRPSIYQTLCNAQRYQNGYFAFWVAEREGIISHKEWQPVFLRSIAHDVRLGKLYAKAMSKGEDGYYSFLYEVSLHTPNLVQYYNKGCCVDGFAFCNSDLLYLPEIACSGNFYLACIRKGNLDLYAHPERVPEKKRKQLNFLSPTRAQIIAAISIALNDGCCCSLLDFAKFFSLTKQETHALAGWIKQPEEECLELEAFFLIIKTLKPMFSSYKKINQMYKSQPNRLCRSARRTYPISARFLL